MNEERKAELSELCGMQNHPAVLYLLKKIERHKDDYGERAMNGLNREEREENRFNFLAMQKLIAEVEGDIEQYERELASEQAERDALKRGETPALGPGADLDEIFD